MEFPYVEAVMGNEHSGIDYTTLVSREEIIARAVIADDMGEKPPAIHEIDYNGQMALIVAWGNDELTQYANAANIELPVPLATTFAGENRFPNELQHLRSAFEQDLDLFDALKDYAESHPLMSKIYVYENENNNADLMTSAKAITLRPAKNLSDVIGEFVMWLSTHAK